MALGHSVDSVLKLAVLLIASTQISKDAHILKSLKNVSTISKHECKSWKPQPKIMHPFYSTILTPALSTR